MLTRWYQSRPGPGIGEKTIGSTLPRCRKPAAMSNQERGAPSSSAEIVSGEQRFEPRRGRHVGRMRAARHDLEAVAGRKIRIVMRVAVPAVTSVHLLHLARMVALGRRSMPHHFDPAVANAAQALFVKSPAIIGDKKTLGESLSIEAAIFEKGRSPCEQAIAGQCRHIPSDLGLEIVTDIACSMAGKCRAGRRLVVHAEHEASMNDAPSGIDNARANAADSRQLSVTHEPGEPARITLFQ